MAQIGRGIQIDEYGEPGDETRFVAPTDCTHGLELSRLAARIVTLARQRPAAIVLDLSHVRAMNSLLLSTVVYIARECHAVGARLRLDGACPLFRAWASTHGLLRHLTGHGLIGPDATSERDDDAPAG